MSKMLLWLPCAPLCPVFISSHVLFSARPFWCHLIVLRCRRHRLSLHPSNCFRLGPEGSRNSIAFVTMGECRGSENAFYFNDGKGGSFFLVLSLNHVVLAVVTVFVVVKGYFGPLVIWDHNRRIESAVVGPTESRPVPGWP